MPLPDLHTCPSTLQPGFTGYSAAAQKDLFGSRSKKVQHFLNFGPPGKNATLTKDYNDKRKNISISGVQEKYSLKLTKNVLALTDASGTHILKPVPAERLERIEDMPANEHTSMQLARQVFGINTAANGMIFFNDGLPAYITRRFDYKADGSGKYQVEDFATLMGKTPEKEKDNYKYNASYLDIANLLQQYVPSATVALLEFFQLLVFNYLIGNGDAHLKNFSLRETNQGDYVLAPAYDLLCTALHIDDHPMALHEGLYTGDHLEDGYRNYGCYTRSSFLAFAEKAGIRSDLAANILDSYVDKVTQAMELVERGFMSAEAKEKYKAVLEERHRCLKKY